MSSSLARHAAAPASNAWEPLRRWRDRWVLLRDRLLASARFQRWAEAFPLTRPVARRRVRALFDLCAGFTYSQILFACVRLRLFEILTEGPLGIDALSQRLSLTREAARRLLDGAVALRLAERRAGGRFGLGPLGAAVAGNPAIAALVEHHGLLYADLRNPVALLRGEQAATALADYWPYAGRSAPQGLAGEAVSAYTALMSASQAFIAEQVLDAYRVTRHRHLLDVGGGDGSFACAVARRAAGIRLTVFDLPAVAAQARARFAAADLVSRAAAVGGDFFADTLPEGADLVSLVRVLHDHDDACALNLLRAIRRMLPPGGTLLIAEPMSGTRGGEPIADAYFGFYLLAMGSGRPRTPAHVQRLLSQAGFGGARLLATRLPALVRVMRVHPAEA
jgi:demethylspheroidene O-methyltransferase